MPPRTRDEFKIAIICALVHEADAVEALFDETYDSLSRTYGKQSGDANTYTNGRIGQHNVVLCYMPGMGIGNAASVASSLRVSYTGIQLALVVGICGGVPFPCGSGNAEIFLGDVIISDSVIQYDLGRQYPDGFQRKTDVKETLGRPIREIRTLLNALKTRRTRKEFQGRIAQHLRTLEADEGMEYAYPGTTHDMLFEATSRHRHYQSISNRCICFDCKSSDDPVCDDALRRDCTSLQCAGKPVYRNRRLDESTAPSIHIGTIASADTVMKSGEHRDRLANSENIIGFEMEGAGVWDNIPCIIIKGVCDYADSHKNKRWQDYAAATGACGAKAFLEYWLPSVRETLTDDDRCCLSDLLLSDPRDDKLRIESTKGGLLNDSFRWILEDHVFRQWRSEEQSQLLWIKGDAGKGKTMLMIGIMDELSRERDISGDSRLVSYFLCEGTNSSLNNATAVLRGLIYSLCVQRPSLTQHLRKKYDHHGRKLFEGAGAFYSLSDILDVMLRNSSVSRVYLLIDAVDECETELDALLDLITRTTKESPVQIKWLISSRNRDDIEQGLGISDSLRRLSLELNVDHISSAIDAFIECKVSQLASLEHYPDDRAQIKDQIRRKSDGTFLWVAVIIKELKGSILADMVKVLDAAPVGLVPLYDQMIQRIEQQEDRNVQRCFDIMSAAVLAYRPLHLHEMRVIAGLDGEISQLTDLERLVNMCCSFFTVRDHSVYFIHQSAKDYLTTKRFAVLFPNGREKVHYDIFFRSISTMSATLRQNIYDLEDFGPLPDNFQQLQDPLAPIRYSCVYWPSHLFELVVRMEEYAREFSDDSKAFSFLFTHLLHWMESLGLMHELPVSTMTIRKLQQNIQRTSDSQFLLFLEDAERFTLHFRQIMDQAPLQVYAAALAFYPINSAVRDQFLNKPSVIVKATKGSETSWSGCLQKMEEHTDWVNAVRFSPDGQILASASSDSMIHLWHVASGTLQRTLKGHEKSVNSISFSPDGSTLASGSEDGTVQIWSISHGTKREIYQSDRSFVTALSFSPDGEDLACVLSTGVVQLWNTASGTWREIRQGQNSVVKPSDEPAVLRSSARNVMESAASYAAASIKVRVNKPWLIKGPPKADVEEKRRKWLATMNSIEGSRVHKIESLSFSPDGKRMVLGSQSGAAHLWDRESASWRQIFHHEEPIKAVVFSPDGRKLALSTEYCKLYTWNMTTEVWKDHSRDCLLARAMAFSPTGQSLASCITQDVHLWNEGMNCQNEKIGNIQDKEYLSAIDFSPNGDIVATGTLQGGVLLWRVPYEYRDRENTPLLSMKLSFRENFSNCASRITDKHALLAYFSWLISIWLVIDEVSPEGLLCRKNADRFRLSPSNSPPDQDTVSLLCQILLLCDFIWFISLYAVSAVLTMVVLFMFAIALSNENARGIGHESKARLLASEKSLRLSQISLDLKVTNHSLEVLEISPSHETSHLISISIDYCVKVLDMTTKKAVKEVSGTRFIERSQILEGSQTVLGFSRDHSMSVWNLRSGTCKEIKAESEPKFPEAAVSSDGRALAQSFKDNEIKFFDAVTGVCIRALKVEEEDLHCITFSPDNQVLAYFTEDTGTIRLWDTATYGSQYILKVEGSIGGFAFSPDSQSIAVALSDSAIRLWGCKKRAWIQAFTGGEGFAKVIAFSWDGKSIASVSQDSSIRVWDIATGTVEETFRPNVEVKKLAFSSDDRYIRTDRGLLARNAGDPMDFRHRQELAWTPFVEKEWILLGGRKVLWIPPEFRDQCCATYWTTVVLGQKSGRLTWIDFKHPDPDFKFPHTSL